MWFAVSCVPSSKSNPLGGLLHKGRQRCDVTQASQTCAFDALQTDANDSGVVLKDYRKIAGRKSVDDDLTPLDHQNVATPGRLLREDVASSGLTYNDITSESLERTYNSSTSSSGYHSGEIAHCSGGRTRRVIDVDPRANRICDEYLSPEDSYQVRKREKRSSNVLHRNSYHGNRDLRYRHELRGNSNFSGRNTKPPAEKGILWGTPGNGQHQSQGEAVSVKHGTNNQNNESFGDWTETSDPHFSVAEGRRNPLGAPSSWNTDQTGIKTHGAPGVNKRTGAVESDRYNGTDLDQVSDTLGEYSTKDHDVTCVSELINNCEWSKLVSCQCENEHCDNYWRKHSAEGRYKTVIDTQLGKAEIQTQWDHDVVSFNTIRCATSSTAFNC